MKLSGASHVSLSFFQGSVLIDADELNSASSITGCTTTFSKTIYQLQGIIPRRDTSYHRRKKKGVLQISTAALSCLSLPGATSSLNVPVQIFQINSAFHLEEVEGRAFKWRDAEFFPAVREHLLKQV